MVDLAPQYQLSIENDYGDDVIALCCLDPAHGPQEASCGSFSLATLQAIQERVQCHQEAYHSGLSQVLQESRWVNRRTGRVSKVVRVWPTQVGLFVEIEVENGARTRNSRSLSSLREHYDLFTDPYASPET